MKKVKIISLITIMVLGNVGVYYFSNISNRADTSTVENTIRTAIHLQYGWGSINKLKPFCTKSFAMRSDFQELRLGLRFYSIEDNEGKAFNYDRDASHITISIEVYSPDLRIHVFTLEKNGDGVYRIDDIQHDI